ncbi:kinase-like domain-containing protein [Camillea tinctor]|nr:kinase-like domain-containing protein [Camillea tinctor]
MELIPYTSREGREIVLRHHNALVVRDPASQRLEIRGAPLTECPTCHRSLRSPSPERRFDASSQHENYVAPNYFRMLQAGHNPDEHNTPHPSPSSPIRRLAQPTLPSGDARIQDVQDAEFISSSPAPHEGARIRRDAFSPNYFKRFFVEERELGRGGKGVVLLVRHQIDGCELGHFACKRVPVGDDHAWLEKVLIEVELLAKLSHPNLVSYRHVWLEDVKLHRFGPTVACAFILQQYCNNGDLLRYVVGDSPKEVTKEQLKEQMRRRSKGRLDQPQGLYAAQARRALPFEEIYSLFRDITSGLAYLHSANYIHRDLKPSNCLLHRENGQLTCLISDFGEVQPGNAIRKSTGTTGTISYCAPEVLKQDTSGRLGNFTTKSDVFSLGMILYFLCFSRLPYQSANSVQEELEDIDELRAEITDWKGFHDERKERPDLPAKLYQLLKKMLALNPAERPSSTEVLRVMNHESNNLHGGPRSSSPHIGLHNRRIQSLDSPMPPGTPAPEPLKHSRDGDADTSEDDFTSADDDTTSFLSPHPSSQNLLQKYPAPTTPRHRPQALTLSRGQDELVRSSPTRVRALGTTTHTQPSPGIHTPLLIAPPPGGPLGVLRQQAVLSQHQLFYFLGSHGDSILFLVKFALFLVKMTSLAKVCWPFMVSLGVGVPLICIAGIDLAIPSYRAVILDGREGSSRALSPAESFRWRWGWRITFSLLLFHCLALWAVSQWGVLCAATQDDWLYW